MTTITLPRSVVQQALDAAERFADAKATWYAESLYGTSKSYTAEKLREVDEARAALRAALEQPQPSPADPAPTLRVEAVPGMDRSSGWPCTIITADFEADTITLKMDCADYRVGAGLHMLLPAPTESAPAAQAEPVRSLVQLDEQYRKALALALDAGRASVSLIQRRLCIGYGEAQALVVRMYRDGYIGVEDTPGVPSEMLCTAPIPAPEPQPSPADPLLNCDIKPRPLAYPLSDYHRAVSEGPLHFQWQDKPHRLLYDLIAAVRHYAAQPAAQAEQPIDMVLHCPKCGMQHVDVPEHWDGKVEVHKSHLCVPAAGGCGHIWRPADVPTNGVQAVKTKGKADFPVAKQPDHAALLADAARYRWLREQHWTSKTMCVVVGGGERVQLGTNCPWGTYLDSLIDAALGGAA